VMNQRVPAVFDRSLQLTAAFEGHGFTKLEGNFDGAGLTWGIIGFTWSNNQLQITGTASYDPVRGTHGVRRFIRAARRPTGPTVGCGFACPNGLRQ
jgi:hypothetical protein